MYALVVSSWFVTIVLAQIQPNVNVSMPATCLQITYEYNNTLSKLGGIAYTPCHAKKTDRLSSRLIIIQLTTKSQSGSLNVSEASLIHAGHINDVVAIPGIYIQCSDQPPLEDKSTRFPTVKCEAKYRDFDSKHCGYIRVSYSLVPGKGVSLNGTHCIQIQYVNCNGAVVVDKVIGTIDSYTIVRAIDAAPIFMMQCDYFPFTETENDPVKCIVDDSKRDEQKCDIPINSVTMWESVGSNGIWQRIILNR